MKLIVGLGNPGAQYAATRHNAGFHVAERLAATQGWQWDGKRDNAMLAQGLVASEKVILAKPQTFMNDSGRAVGPLIRFFKVPLADLLIICDDLDLPLGRVRLREKGSAAGQHGLESVIAHLSSPAFARLRVGIGRPAHPRMQIIDYVLGTPQGADADLFTQGEARAAEAALAWATEGITAAMNRFNPELGAAPRPTSRPSAQLPRDPLQPAAAAPKTGVSLPTPEK